VRPEDRDRGRIEERGGSLRVVVYAGLDPVTGKRVYLRETIPGTTKAAYKHANTALNKLLSQVAEQRSANSSVTLGYAIDEWMRTSELEDSTRKTYDGYIERTIRPVLGSFAAKKMDARTLESFYTELRRCRTRCDGKPFIEKHKADGERDCVAEKCKPHVCRPIASSTVRQIHSIISGTLAAAERWGWITSNPARIARRPKQKPRSQIRPPLPKPPGSSKRHSRWTKTGVYSSGSR
jgi:integrase